MECYLCTNSQHIGKSEYSTNLPGVNRGKALLGATIPTPKFKISEIPVVTYILNKTVFIPFKVFLSKISSEIECFRVPRNQRLFCH